MMIDLDKIERRCREAMKNGFGKHPVIECASAEAVLEIITRLRQAEKDAARYLFMRAWSQSHSLNVYRKDLWDEIIDREISNESRAITKANNGGEL